MTEPLGTVSLTSTSPPGPSTMKRGRSNPAAYSFTEKPAGTLICAPAGRGTIFGAFGFGGACARITAARKARARIDFMASGLPSYTAISDVAGSRGHSRGPLAIETTARCGCDRVYRRAKIRHIDSRQLKHRLDFNGFLVLGVPGATHAVQFGSVSLGRDRDPHA